MPQLPSPFLVCIGGLDPTGGAGLLRDYLTATALGARATVVATAFTVQSDGGVTGFEPRSPQALAAHIAQVLDHLAGGQSGGLAGVAVAVKVGMTGTPGGVAAVMDGLRGFAGPVVFDPVLAASSGGTLFAGAPAELLPLAGRASLCTPNLAEAAALLGRPLTTAEDARMAARELRQAGARAVLVKGGHLDGDAVDHLADGVNEQAFSARRLPGDSPRGTGCALATAIAVHLARGATLADAVAAAKAWLHARIEQSRSVAGARLLD